METNQLEVYHLENEHIKLAVTNIGASVTSLCVKDQHGQWVDVVLGFADLTHHQTKNDVCFGSVVGRNANRIKNGEFTLNNVSYQLEKNNGTNNLHSGSAGFHLRYWELVKKSADTLILKIVSPDGDQGFPGNMVMTVEYALKNNDVLIKYSAESDQDSLFNPTNHSYFNLNGHKSGSVLEHSLKLPSHYFMPMDSSSVPTGERRSVINTPMDFLTEKKLASQFDLSDEQLKLGNGYDHHFVLDEGSEPILLSASESGISLSVTTDMPGVQVYTANFVNEVVGKDQALYNERTGVCLETQFCPNAINNPEEVAPIIKKDVPVSYQTIWHFDTV